MSVLFLAEIVSISFRKKKKAEYQVFVRMDVKCKGMGICDRQYKAIDKRLVYIIECLTFQKHLSADIFYPVLNLHHK